MKFENKYQFQEWLGELLYRELGNVVTTEENNATGHCQVTIVMENDDEINLSISMEKGEA